MWGQKNKKFEAAVAAIQTCFAATAASFNNNPPLPTLQYRPTGLPFHAGLPTLPAAAGKTSKNLGGGVNL